MTAAFNHRAAHDPEPSSTKRRRQLKEAGKSLESFATVTLVVLGLFNISYQTFRGGGWLEFLMEYFAELFFSRPGAFLSVGLLLLSLMAYLHDRDMTMGAYEKWRSAVALYIMMGNGIFFIYWYLI